VSIVHIPFYPSDWLAGTAALSDAEKGVYITLVARMYEMAGPIERDDNRLYRVCGSKSKASFVKALNYLVSEGKIIETPDGLINEKAAKVIEQTTEKSSKAKAAAQSRWDRKPNKNNGGSDANASAEHMPQQCQPEPKPELKKEGTNVPLVQSGFPEQDFQDFWDAYPHRNGKKKRKDAEAVFAKAIKRGVTVQQIAEGVANMRNDPDVQRGYARDPTTWLNQQGWTDEFDAKPQLKTIDGGRNERTNRTETEQRPDPAIERIAFLAGLSPTSGNGRG
jgi:uncharacterized protein YdaU (DUF1376 family)